MVFGLSISIHLSALNSFIIGITVCALTTLKKAARNMTFSSYEPISSRSRSKSLRARGGEAEAAAAAARLLIAYIALTFE